MRDLEAHNDKLAAPVATSSELAIEVLRLLDRVFPLVVYPAAIFVVVVARQPLATGLVCLGFVLLNILCSLLTRLRRPTRLAEALRYLGFAVVLLALPSFAGVSAPS